MALGQQAKEPHCMTSSAPATIALAFAQALVDGDFARAHAMLATALHETLSADSLREHLVQMLAYTGQSAEGAAARVESEMDDWPDKQPGDAGWAYVSISKDGPEASYAEAVIVVVTDEGLIRDVAWGRP
jgi:hypothetical protein